MSPELTFRPAHLLKAIRRSVDGARSYTLLEQALTRLQGTHVAMVENKAQHEPHVQFNLIERFERPTKGPWTVVVPPWFVEQIAGAKILLVDPAYFALRGPLVSPRNAQHGPEKLRIGEAVLDLSRELLLDPAGRAIPLRRKSLDLLTFLAQNTG